MERDARQRKEMAIDEDCARKTGERWDRRSEQKAPHEDRSAESATRKAAGTGRISQLLSANFLA